jgi:ppGpp synthetase/RelA/SpoT-type nucleotidyltranferase
MDLEQRPSWSKGDLRRLGEALVIDKAATRDGRPQYGEVMLWHNDLAAEIAARIANTPWVAMPQDQLSISARAKTIDTIVQKLQRKTTLKLGQVQDLAGVRIDADMVLTQQTDLAQEIAEHFGAARAKIKDMRATPHSGYRAVHVWLDLPAGRVEVQIRTLSQSDWANAYEALGEFYGRGIRYGEEHEAAHVREMVDIMSNSSAMLAETEEVFDDEWQFERLPRRLRRRLGQVGAASKRNAQLHADLREHLTQALEGLRNMHRIMDENPGLRYSDDIRGSTPAKEV